MSDVETQLETRVGFLVPLNKLPPDRQTRLLADSEVIKLKKKQTLFSQGDRDDFTYYLIEGEIEMYADDSLIKRVTGGDGASFQPLAQLQPRQMSAVAKTSGQVLQVRRSLLDQLLSMDDVDVVTDNGTGVEVQEMESDQDSDWLMTLLQSELFTRIPPSNIQGLLDTLETVYLEAGDAVIKQGESGDYYYAIQSGACEVVRTGANEREIKLADLHAGATFGEEALISGAKRNATVRMTQAGELARLTKADFIRLVKAPLLNSITRDEAEKMIVEGAVWLDVRFEDEHQHNGIQGSLNIPHGMLRKRMPELDRATTYIAYCDSGGRSSAAAFLLAEKGFAVCFVDGGAVDEPQPVKAATKPATKIATPSATPAKSKDKAPAPAKTAATAELKAESTQPTAPSQGLTSQQNASASNQALLEANALASSLSAEAEKAQLMIDKARQMMAEAEAMKQEAERLVAEKLASERSRMDADAAKLQEKFAQAEALTRNAEISVAAKLAEERARLDSEVAKLKAQVAQAEISKRETELTVAEKLAEERSRLDREVAKLQEQVAQAENSKRETEQAVAEKLAEERSRIDSEVAKLHEQVTQAEISKREAEQAVAEQLDAERARIRAEASKLEAKLAEAERARREAGRVADEKLTAERTRIAAETAQLQQNLAEAQRLKEALSAQQKAAEDEAARYELEVEERVKALEQEARERLREEEMRLEALFQKQTELLETTQAGREVKLREKLSDELAAERRKFEQGVMRATDELEHAKEERAQAIAAKEAAAAEAQAMIANFKVQQNADYARQQAALDEERKRLTAEAARIERIRGEVTAAREAAEAAQRQAELELQAARSRQATQAATADALQIIEIEERATAAERDLLEAIAAESEIATAARKNDDELERTYDTASDINMLLQKELNDFVGEQNELQDSTLQREVLARQKEMVDRIKARAKQMQQQTVDRNKSLLDEIAEQLNSK